MTNPGATGGRRALVTGASSGIGEATVRLLARAGYRLALLARRQERMQQIVQSLPGQGGHLILAGDVGDEQFLARARARIETEFGALELLVNNAGQGYRAPVEKLNADQVRSVFSTNVLGPLLVCQQMLGLLRRGSRPVLVQVSSVVAGRGVPGQAVYSASKAALSSISQALRLEWAQAGIAVCDLRPGLTATAFFESQVNPGQLPQPNLARAHAADRVAQAILELDRNPRPELWLNSKWRWLAGLGVFWPGAADRLAARKLLDKHTPRS